MLNSSTLCTYKYSEIEKSSQNQEDFLIIFSADSTSYASKPPDDVIGCISNGVLSGYRFDLSIKDLAYDLFQKENRFHPAYFLKKEEGMGLLVHNQYGLILIPKN